MKITPFAIEVSNEAVADLALRLEMTRWPDEVGVGGWEYGMPRKVLRDVVDCWRDGFDWRAAERRLDGLPQFGIEIDGRVIHYVHVKGVDQESAPLVLTHGWPGSFVEMYKILPMLVDPANNGLPGHRSFDSCLNTSHRSESAPTSSWKHLSRSLWTGQLSAQWLTTRGIPRGNVIGIDMRRAQNGNIEDVFSPHPTVARRVQRGTSRG